MLQAEYRPARYLSADALSLLARMLCPDPAERASVAEVQQHPWFQTDLPPDCLALNPRLMTMQVSTSKFIHTTREYMH